MRRPARKFVDAEPTSRRDIFFIAAGTIVVLSGAPLLWTAIKKVNLFAPLAFFDRIKVDLTPVQPGQSLRVDWRNLPIFIRHRTAQEISAARSADIKELKDRVARNPELPTNSLAIDSNRVKGHHDEWLVVIGVCTHLNCYLNIDDKGAYAGWVCPCHGALFDTAGRIREGPASTNLVIPPYRFITNTLIEIG